MPLEFVLGPGRPLRRVVFQRALRHGPLGAADFRLELAQGVNRVRLQIERHNQGRRLDLHDEVTVIVRPDNRSGAASTTRPRRSLGPERAWPEATNPRRTASLFRPRPNEALRFECDAGAFHWEPPGPTWCLTRKRRSEAWTPTATSSAPAGELPLWPGKQQAAITAWRKDSWRGGRTRAARPRLMGRDARAQRGFKP
jgi:hypothetical protein